MTEKIMNAVKSPGLKNIGIPAVTCLLFLLAWAVTAPQIKTSLGKVPGPVEVGEQVQSLIHEFRQEKAKEKAFYVREKERVAKKLEENPGEEVKTRKYSGKPTFLDQIITSLITVFAGFFIASIIAIPLGVLCGLSRTLRTALNPLIQIFKPVSPVAWLPIVTMVVSAVYTAQNPWFEKCFIISAVTVALCSLWPSLINTALGVASIDKDYINVARVLKLKFSTKIFKIVLPAALPYIFTGLRISLGVGWMVLIAAELLSQNPGLGKFVWDEFQNGSSQSLARIMVAVFTIGIIGFFLDRVMVTLNKWVSFGQATVS
ncbi:MAG: ABC transporter permease [Candidatus Omnitrophica bacterium]|nr:ABC transporter permease [Candidatus Omnitrophota bacterium]